MGLKIVTGGTTGAADGTLVSSGNNLTFSALNTAINAHIRCDDGYWSNDQAFTVPAEVEVSFDGGSTWLGSGTNPNTAPEIEDVNYPIKLRQKTSAASTSGTLTTDGTYTAITALATVSGFTATSGNAQVSLSWSAVANRTYYQVQRATDSGFTTGLTTLTSTLTTTSLVDTGLTNGTTYYYRIKALGTGRYSDSAAWATANATPAIPSRSARWIQWEWIAPHQGPDGTLLNVLEIEVVGSSGAQASGPDLLPTSIGSWSASESYSTTSPDTRPYRIADDTAFGSYTSGTERWASTLGNENSSHWVKCDLGSSQTIHSWRMQRYGSYSGGAFATKQPYNFKMWVSTLASPSAKVIGADSNADWVLVDSGTLDLTTGSANLVWQAWRTVS